MAAPRIWWGNDLGQAVPFDELHGVVMDAAFLPHRVHGDNMGMVQRGGHTRLVLKPPALLAGRGVIREEGMVQVTGRRVHLVLQIQRKPRITGLRAEVSTGQGCLLATHDGAKPIRQLGFRATRELLKMAICLDQRLLDKVRIADLGTKSPIHVDAWLKIADTKSVSRVRLLRTLARSG